MSTPRYVPCYYVRSPSSGAWMRAPLQGSSLNVLEAHPYPSDSGHLAYMVGLATALHVKLRLRQAHCPHQALLDAMERDIEATPAPEFVECPDCEGCTEHCDNDGHWQSCPRCRGTGNVPAPKVVCPDCEGTGGSSRFGKCKRCRGTGTISA